jgi:hypothetical protein
MFKQERYLNTQVMLSSTKEKDSNDNWHIFFFFLLQHPKHILKEIKKYKKRGDKNQNPRGKEKQTIKDKNRKY